MHPNLIWVPKLKQEEEVILNKILQLDRQVDEKQKLEIDIEQLKGKLVVVKHIEGEGVDVKKHSEELTEQLIERIEEMEDLEAPLAKQSFIFMLKELRKQAANISFFV
jgi:nitrate reductase NapAB chaperone NapD